LWKLLTNLGIVLFCICSKIGNNETLRVFICLCRTLSLGLSHAYFYHNVLLHVACITFYFPFHLVFAQENAYAMLESHLRKLRKTSRYVSNSSGCMVEIKTCRRYGTTFNHIKSKFFVFGLRRFSLDVSAKTRLLPVHTFYSSLKTPIIYLIKFIRAW
jgi:hypothetical protein